ncbi:MAG: hypothetical protein KAS32_13580 [Candidatus Peribacteraceae bacterium]|nr:hypothetical protein [Candidatus Peribacteraceae bacterium]
MIHSMTVYKPSYDDYCRGCLMTSYSSSFEYLIYDSVEEIIEKWAHILCDEEYNPDGAAKEIEYLQNGYPVDDNWEIKQKATALAATMIKETKERKAIAIAEIKRKNAIKKKKDAIENARIKEEKDRKRYAELKAKYESE